MLCFQSRKIIYNCCQDYHIQKSASTSNSIISKITIWQDFCLQRLLRYDWNRELLTCSSGCEMDSGFLLRFVRDLTNSTYQLFCRKEDCLIWLICVCERINSSTRIKVNAANVCDYYEMVGFSVVGIESSWKFSI